MSKAVQVIKIHNSNVQRRPGVRKELDAFEELGGGQHVTYTERKDPRGWQECRVGVGRRYYSG